MSLKNWAKLYIYIISDFIMKVNVFFTIVINQVILVKIFIIHSYVDVCIA